MASSAERSDPALWDRVKKEVTDGDKGGDPGEWSARKAQMAVQRYKAEGGGYKGRKAADNHLAQWTREDWGTKSGDASKATGERYLPKQAREALSDAEYARTTAKKRADTAKGKQFSAQPKDVAAKTADGSPVASFYIQSFRCIFLHKLDILHRGSDACGKAQPRRISARLQAQLL